MRKAGFCMRARDEHHLTLATRYLGIHLVAQIANAQALERGFGFAICLARGAAKEALTCDRPHDHDVEHAEGKRRLVNLRHVADE